VGFCKENFLGTNGRSDVRVENPSQVILVNINTLKGKVYENGALVTDENKTMHY
jgi:hypothetical protein